MPQLSSPLGARGPIRSERRGTVQWFHILIVLMLLAVFIPTPSEAASTVVGPKTYYLALGDSSAFGYQPNFDWNHGYSDQWFPDLQAHGVQTMVNYACPEETTTSFIWGGCYWWFLQRTFHTGSQLSAAVKFIRAHPGQVSPVSISIGPVDMLLTTLSGGCEVNTTKWNMGLATVDFNLKYIILPQIVNAMTDGTGHRTGDIVMVNAYNPVVTQCPDDGPYVEEFNRHLAADASLFSIPIADAYSAFNTGPNATENICAYTWVCAANDGHATGGQPGEPGNGYGVIAGVLEQTLGY